jgi:Rrf2 family transcriptional regulator, iron-sulfur cluster assembly transcription factor
VRCTPGEAIGCRGDRSRCLTHDLWAELSNQIHLYLCSVSLGDVCEKRVLGTSGLAQRETYQASSVSPGSTSGASFETPAARAPQDEVSL